MAKKICKCSVCNREFDRNSIQAVKSSARRYAHFSCMPTGELVPMETSASEDPDLKVLNDYINKIYGNKANWPLIRKQIKTFHEKNNYSYTGIQKTLQWFYEIQHNSIDSSNGGIGIVEYTYQQSYEYFFNLYKASQINKNKDFSLLDKTKEITINLNKKKKVKLMDMDWSVEDEE